jgi:dephospho-CoA kinase
MIIGIAGYARSGKDAAAKILVEHYGYERRAFADILRSALLTLNPVVKGTPRVSQKFAD